MKLKQFMLLGALILSTITVKAQEKLPAFPGAEGFGRYVTGGRGGTVYHVKNLKDSGYQSLRWSLAQNPGKPKIIVFDISGTIHLESELSIPSNVTIAGQTAPGEGITIYGGRVIASKSKNIILRYLRMRGGKSVNSSKCTLTLDNGENVIMDNCSDSWGPWENDHMLKANNIT